MGRKRSDDGILSEGSVSETGNWNEAKAYAGLKIFKLLLEVDEYRKICKHGTSELIDEIMVTDQDKIKARLIGIERYISTTQMVIDNSLFSIRDPKDKQELETYYLALELLENSLPSLKILKTMQGYNGTLQSIDINEKIYDFILKTLIELNKKILYPLNRNDLIFYHIEEFDPDKVKKEFMEKFVNEG